MRKYCSDEQVAAIVHAAVSRLLFEQGEILPSRSWESELENVREAYVDSVRMARSGVTPKTHHESWRKLKEEQGWRYGAEKDPVRKTHPYLVAYDELPEYVKDRNRLFLMIVTALTLEA